MGERDDVPAVTVTLHFPHFPDPPQMASMETPALDAASRMVVPTAMGVFIPKGWNCTTVSTMVPRGEGRLGSYLTLLLVRMSRSTRLEKDKEEEG
jgi:hypothetical protein